MRKNLSPTFSSGKLKGMLEPMSGVADRMMDHIDSLVPKNPVVDLKDVFQGEQESSLLWLSIPGHAFNCFPYCDTGLALNVISSCAFGIDADAHKNPDQDLVKYGRAAFSNFRISSWVETVIMHLLQYFPGAERFLPLLPKEWYLLGQISKDIMKQR